LLDAVEYLAELSWDLALELMEFLCSELPEFAAAIVIHIASLGGQLFDIMAQGLTWLWRNSGAGWQLILEGFSTFDFDTFVGLVEGLFALGLLPLIGGVLAGLWLFGEHELVRAYFAIIDEGILAPLISAAGQTLYPIFVWIFDECWPQGYGVRSDRKSTRLNSSHVKI